MNKQTFITKSFEKTQKIAEDFSSKLTEGGIVALYGDLGSGKTTFVQGLAKGLGIKQRIISPTFIIVRQYKVRGKESAISGFYHIDLYRTETIKDIQSLGIEEIMNDPQNIVVIEWAEKMKNMLSTKRINIEFEYISEKERKITIIYE